MVGQGSCAIVRSKQRLNQWLLDLRSGQHSGYRPETPPLYTEMTVSECLTGTGKLPRLDMRGFPNKNGADTTRVTYTSQA